MHRSRSGIFIIAPFLVSVFAVPPADAVEILVGPLVVVDMALAVSRSIPK